jgi:hypothetical protein
MGFRSPDLPRLAVDDPITGSPDSTGHTWINLIMRATPVKVRADDPNCFPHAAKSISGVFEQ